MRFVLLLTVAALPAMAETVTLTDQINNNLFASSSYTLIANNAKAITFSSFSDGNSTTSAPEVNSTPDMRIPNAPDGIMLPSGEHLTAATYDLAYLLFLTGNRNRTDTGSPSRAQTDPVFGLTNENFEVTLVFRDLNGNTLDKVDVTTLSTTLDLLPFLLDNGPIEAAFESTGLFLRTKFRADSTTFTADLSGYDPVNNPDRNVQLDYNLKEHLTAFSQVTLTFVPEPAEFGMIGAGLAGLAVLRRKRTN